MARAVGTQRDDVFQPLQTVSEMRAAVLLQLVVSGPIALRFPVGLLHQSSFLSPGAHHRGVRGQAQQLGHRARQ